MIHTSAASLYRALLDLAAQSPDDDFAHLLEDFRPADEGEAADCCAVEFRTEWRDGAWRVRRDDDLQASASPMVAVHGPQRPIALAQPKVMFTSRMPDGARSSFTVKRTRPSLTARAELVRKQWALFGGGPKPAELVNPAAKRRAVEYKPALLRAWADMIDEGSAADAMELGDTLGALYYPGAGTRPIVLAGPQQVAGLPDGTVSAYRAHDRRFVVMHTASGRTIGQSAASRKAAEADALAIVARRCEESGPDAFAKAIAAAPVADQAQARADWAKAHSAVLPDAPAAEPAPVTEPEPAESADAWAARMVAMGATSEPAPDAPAADVEQPAAPEAAEPVPLDWQTLAARPTAIYATPVRKIGVHEWRTVVYAHGTYGACTDHVWRRVDQNRGAFKMARDWPTYDSDRTHSGLPLTLGKLYAEHEEAIKAALNSLRLADPAPAAAPAAEPAAAPLEFVSRYTGPRCNGMSALSAKIECAKRAKDEPDFSFVVAECKGEGLPAYQVAALRGKYEVQRWRRAAPAAAPLPCPAPCPAAPPAPASRSAPVAPIEGYSTSPDHSEHPLDVSARKLAELRAEMADEPLAGHRSDGFLQYVIGAREADHARLESAFAAFAAVGDGTEMVNKDGRRYCIMLPDASQPGKYRWQGFDERGFFTHSTHSTAEDAVADAASQGYYTAAPGALDRLASLPAWARGMAINEVMQEHNSGRMTWADACERMGHINAEHDALAAAAAPAAAAPGPEAAPAVPAGRPGPVAPVQMPTGAVSTSLELRPAPVRFPHRQATGARFAHHVKRAAPARQRQDSIRPPFVQHARIPVRACSSAEHFPIGAEHLAWATTQSSPSAGEFIGTLRATMDDKLDRAKRIRSIERAKGSSFILEVPAAAHQQPESLCLHSLLFGEQRPAILGKAGLHMNCSSEPHMTRQPFDGPALSSPPVAAASPSSSQSRRLSFAAAVMFPPAKRSHRKGESPQAIGPSVPGSYDPMKCLRMNPQAGFQERIGPWLPGYGVLIMHPAWITRNSQAPVRPVMRRSHGPPIGRVSTNPESEQHL